MPNDAGGGPRPLELMRGRPRKGEKRGAVLGNARNVALALRELPEFKGAIGRDIRSGRIVARRPIYLDLIDRTLDKDDWDDSYTTEVQAWLQAFGIPAEWKTAARGIAAVADLHKFNPVEEYLRGLKPWDGEPRLDDFLHTYFGAKKTKVNRAISAMFMIGAVARGVDLGCQMDNALFIEGPQEILKTSAVRVMGGPFGCEELTDFHSKDAKMTACEKWIIEISENTAKAKSKPDDIKAFITRRKETYRRPYGEYIRDQGRGSVLVGTINPQGGYLDDPTGGRRYWPFEAGVCHGIDIPALKKDMLQLWAETLAHYDAGEHWRPETAELRRLLAVEQDERYEGDVWDFRVEAAAGDLLKDGPFSMERVCLLAIPQLEVRNITREIVTRVGQILAHAGYERRGRKRLFRRVSKRKRRVSAPKRLAK
jgi:predicted P-loop ATPase